MRAEMRRRLERLEAGDTDQAERYAAVARITREWCEEHGIPESTEAEKKAFRTRMEAAKPANYDSLPSIEQTNWLIGYLLSDDAGEAGAL